MNENNDGWVLFSERLPEEKDYPLVAIGFNDSGAYFSKRGGTFGEPWRCWQSTGTPPAQKSAAEIAWDNYCERESNLGFRYNDSRKFFLAGYAAREAKG